MKHVQRLKKAPEVWVEAEKIVAVKVASQDEEGVLNTSGEDHVVN